MDSLTRPYPTGPWLQAAQSAGLLQDGVPSPTIFEEMTTLAGKHGAVNLGQGFPDEAGPEWMRQRAADLIVGRGDTQANQYALGAGLPDLRRAVSEHQQRYYGLEYSPDDQILVTTGATEGIAATILALVSAGDEVITFEPFYDSYAAMIALAGAKQVVVEMDAPGFQPDAARLEEAITERTALVIMNTPHNPTGTVLDQQRIDAVLNVAVRHDLWVLSDEVYEHLVYDGSHRPLASTTASHGGTAAQQKVITVSSAGKSFSLTGWKVGWVMAQAGVIAAIRTVKQFLTYSSGPAYQYAVADALRQGDAFLAEQRDRFRTNRDQLVTALRYSGLDPATPAAGYFVVVDTSAWGYENAMADASRLVTEVGLVGIPVAALCRPDHTPQHLRPYMRFAFCKKPEVMTEAVRLLGNVQRA